jgi:hypothetical protein
MIKHIDQILDENKPVWVKNIHKPRGQIVLAMTDRSGQVVKLILPPINHPVCISDRVTPETLRHSTALRDLINKKVIQLVSTTEAQVYYENNPHAAEDVHRAFSRQEYNNPEIAQLRELGNKDDELLYHKQGSAIVAGDKPSNLPEDSEDFDDVKILKSDDDGDVQARVKVLVEALNSREKKAREVRSDLETIDLTDADLAYLVANTTGLVETYAKKEFATRRGQQNSEFYEDSE